MLEEPAQRQSHDIGGAQPTLCGQLGKLASLSRRQFQVESSIVFHAAHMRGNVTRLNVP